MRFLPLIAFALYTVTATAQMYSWKDAEGKTQYSDQPPPGKLPVRKLAAPSAPAELTTTRQQALSEEMAARQKQKEKRDAASKAEKEQANAEENRANCEKAKSNLQSIEAGIIRYSLSAGGERVALEGAARDAELANARKAVDSWCK